ncbi:Hypothetical predicted protein [Pelobates cultripes]|uniref:Uncharacterized protein n=1 Tax=Pelobates cultripes TaxID=61616 RepID=A0AAD1RQ53_PELCU|nr:Hypothetical predicted protein [Pelobates cultripes]
MLARTMKPRPRHPHITSIKVPDGTIRTSPNDIAQVFMAFYKTLYNHSPTYGTSNDTQFPKINKFLSNYTLPKLYTKAIEALGAPISQEDINLTISALKRGKAPVPDDFERGYYMKN